jgi:predicted nucleic acid-binding protein
LTAVAVGLLDTSVFICRESARPLGELPERVAVSVITILATRDPDRIARRADTLALARTSDPIPISEAIMVAWAHLVSDCRAAGVHRTVRLTDALIAATATEHGLPVVTQDDDFETIATAHPRLDVIRV